MYTSFVTCTLAAVLGFVNGHGLSSAEVLLFSNTGSQGGSVSVDTSDPNTYTINANGLPDHTWQQVNPNTPSAQSYSLTVNRNVNVDLNSKKCVPMGVMGLTKHGVAVYNLLTSANLNAVEGDGAETFDSCDGHPTNTGSYHYHKLPSSCVYSSTTDEFLGVAIDGIPFYGPKVSWQTNDVTSSDLDECNGKTVNGEYKYFVTTDWPYYMSCLRGEVVDSEYTSQVSSVTCGSTSVFDSVCSYFCPCTTITDVSSIECSSSDGGRVDIPLKMILITVFVVMFHLSEMNEYS